ncbi:MAG: BA14K family protein [Oricola sp.]
MKTNSIKTSVVAIATAATLLTSGIVPVTQASAKQLGPQNFGAEIQPQFPGPCLVCGPGDEVLPPLPPAPPPPAPPAPGINAGAAAALLIGGVIAGAAIANATQPKDVYVEPVGNADAHINWCFGKYKSYRMSDNTYQPFDGPRKQCISPYI